MYPRSRFLAKLKNNVLKFSLNGLGFGNIIYYNFTSGSDLIHTGA